MVTAGASGVGVDLLRRVVDAYEPAREQIPGLRMLAVTGPRIEPQAPQAPAGVELAGFLPDLQLRLAAADLAVVQGGLTTRRDRQIWTSPRRSSRRRIRGAVACRRSHNLVGLTRSTTTEVVDTRNKIGGWSPDGCAPSQ